MIRLPLALALLAVPAAATPQSVDPRGPAERRELVGSFDRVRIDGPLEVVFRPGSPSARVIGDRRAIEDVDISADGSTLRLRRFGLNADDGARVASGAPIRVALSSPALRAASVSAGARLQAARMRGPQVDLAVNGAGAIEAGEVTGDQLSAILVGPGTITLSGKARTARLAVNGPGRIDASGLEVGDLTVLQDGPGETKAAARYTAKVTNAGLGLVEVAGRPKCTVSARAGGPVRCGK
ncbi:GIN domain-containing protein [Sphingomonas lenta]|uniref:DUF2807 domain-containing protein n=1 Tax=Sphingomonas lenta TaxID=1141887 RepID=A0A2A2SF24_9SPHN|nr:DUF2807 domain-containing protein [Sphingomonas lenta]PAX07904.1 DUF2807 domain-containing protein [Sphingomonas lenta]